MSSISRLLGCAALLSFLATQFPSVSAHGHVSRLVIDGKNYTGASPYQNSFSSVIRQITDVSPVKSLTSPDLTCGVSAKPASLVANVTSGSRIEIHWSSGDGGNWPHYVGPLMTYVANCANNDCTTDTAATSKWVKIDEAGQKTPGGDWFMKDLYDGKPYTVTLPSSLPAGSYLMRHEIIALHTATTLGGAEFYPSCSQLQVTGARTTPLVAAVPSADIASFPGSYNATDPGLLVPNVYNPGFDYTGLFPGPAIPTSFSSTGGNTTTRNPTTGNSTTTPPPSTPDGGCDDGDNDNNPAPSPDPADEARVVVVTMTITIPPPGSPSTTSSTSSSTPPPTPSPPYKRAYAHRSNRMLAAAAVARYHT